MFIKYLDGSIFDMETIGVTRLFHRPSAIEVEDNAQIIVGRDGDIPSDSFRYASRTLSVDFAFQVKDIQDFYLMRDQVNDVLTARQDFYIIFKREPYIKWLVRRLTSFTIEPNPKGGTFTVEFKCSKVLAMSTYSTRELMGVDNDKTWDEDKFAWNNSISWDADFDYSFTNVSNVNINNGGTALVNPRENFLHLSFITQNAVPGSLKIYNSTTNEQVIFYGDMIAGTKVELLNTKLILNGTSWFGKSSHTLMSLKEGLNHLSFTDGNNNLVTMSSVTADFNYLYK